MKITFIRAGRLRSLGNFENERIELGAEVQEGEDPIQVAGELQDQVRKLLGQPTRAEEAAGKLVSEVNGMWNVLNAELREAHEARREAKRYDELAAIARREADALSQASEAETERASHLRRAERYLEAAKEGEERGAAADLRVAEQRAKAEARELEPEVQAARALLNRQPPKLWEPPAPKPKFDDDEDDEDDELDGELL